jgi:hypothetical protein
MKLAKNAKIEAVCSDDDTRRPITAPYLEVNEGKGLLIATNGRAMAILPVEVGERDVTGYVSPQALVASRKLVRGNGDIEVDCNEACTLKNGAAYPRPFAAPAGAGEDYVPTRFPNWRQVLPDKDRVVKTRVAINPSLLMDLAKAMGSEGSVVLEFGEDEKDIIRLVSGDKVGLLIPMRVS